MRFFILALVLALTNPAALAGDTCRIAGMPNIQGLDYQHARAKLIRAGFKPVRYNPASTGGAPQSCEDYSFKANFPETGVTSNGGCDFTWKTPAGKHFSIGFTYVHKYRYLVDCP